jgi:hypothetical protein
MLNKPVEPAALQILQKLDYSTYSYPGLPAEDQVSQLIRVAERLGRNLLQPKEIPGQARDEE